MMLLGGTRERKLWGEPNLRVASCSAGVTKDYLSRVKELLFWTGKLITLN